MPTTPDAPQGKISVTLHLECGHVVTQEIGARSPMAHGHVKEGMCPGGHGLQKIERMEKGDPIGSVDGEV